MLLPEKNEARVHLAVETIRRFVPQFRIVAKRDSRLHRAIGWLLSRLGNKEYLNTYWTTLGFTAAWPEVLDERGFDSKAWMTVLHEGLHALQAKRLTRLGMSALYLLPQLLIIAAPICAVMAAITANLTWLWGLLALVAAAPLPALARAAMERAAYKVTLAAEWWSGRLPDVAIENRVSWLTGVFAGDAYYKMWPFANQVRNWFLSDIHDLRYDEVVMTPYLAAVRALAEQFRAEDAA